MASGVKIIKKPSRGTALNTVFTTTTLLEQKKTTLKQKTEKRGLVENHFVHIMQSFNNTN